MQDSPMSLERITELASDLETSRRAWAILHESAQRDAQRFQKRITELVEKVNSYVVESARQAEHIAELEAYKSAAEATQNELKLANEFNSECHNRIAELEAALNAKEEAHADTLVLCTEWMKKHDALASENWTHLKRIAELGHQKEQLEIRIEDMGAVNRSLNGSIVDQGERIAELEAALSQTSRLAVADVDASRAVLMLDIAAQYIRDHCPDGEIFYDETECAGSCVADDCEIAAQALRREAESREGK